MIESIIYLIAVLLIVGVIWWGVNQVLGVIPVPEPIRTVIHVLLIVLLCIVVIYVLLGLVGTIPRPLLR